MKIKIPYYKLIKTKTKKNFVHIFIFKILDSKSEHIFSQSILFDTNR